MKIKLLSSFSPLNSFLNLFYCFIVWSLAAWIGISISYAEIVKEIVVEGNTKTKRKALLRSGKIHEGDDIDEKEVNVIRERLSQNPQYILKEVSFKNGIFKIVIEDKWSLIPIPMITQSGYYYSRGLMIYESNFLGQLVTLVPAVTVTNSGPQGLIAYKDDSLFSDDIGLRMVAIKKSDLSRFSRRNQYLHTFESKVTALVITPSYSYGSHTFKAGPVIFTRNVYNQYDRKVYTFSGNAAQLRYNYNAKNFMKTEVSFSGYYLTYNMFILPSAPQRAVYLHDIEFEYSYPIIGNFGTNFLSFLLLGRTANDRSYLYPDLLGGKEGFRGYDSMSLPTYQYGSASIQYQQQVWNRIYTTFFYEVNSARLIDPVLEDYGRQQLKEHTIGLGARYYFKKISIPAIVVEYARNLNDRTNHLHFNLGVSL